MTRPPFDSKKPDHERVKMYVPKRDRKEMGRVTTSSEHTLETTCDVEMLYAKYDVSDWKSSTYGDPDNHRHERINDKIRRP